MQIICIDDYGNIEVIREINQTEAGHKVMELAKEEIFIPCGVCGKGTFVTDWDEEQDCCGFCSN